MALPITRPSNAILALDWMKISRDVVLNQPPQALYQSITGILNANFPQLSHVAISTPMDTQAAFVSNAGNTGGGTPGPLTVDAFIDMQADVIHNGGYNVIWRCFPASEQKAYGFPLKVDTSTNWVTYNQTFLTRHLAHIKSGDVIALWYELDWWQRDFGTSINDTGNLVNDTNSFIVKNATMVANFATANNLSLRALTTYSDVGTNYTPLSVATAQNAVVIDHYGNTSNAMSLGLSDTQLIAQFNTSIQAYYNNFSGKFPVYIQEWGDIRKSTPDGSIQTTDPNLTGMMADQAFFPAIQSGVMIGIDFWDLFNTPKEGIIDFYNSSNVKLAAGHTSGAVSAQINPKGTYLATIWNKWWGGTPVVNPPVTTINLSPPAYVDGYFANPITVTLTAVPGQGRTIANTFYTVDGGGQTTYSTPFAVSGLGSHTIVYWSVDNMGLTESHHTYTFIINYTVNKAVSVGYTSHQYAQIFNDYLPDAVFQPSNVIPVDYYGNFLGNNDYSPGQYQADIQAITSGDAGIPAFWSEWADQLFGTDYGNDRIAYEASIYNMMSVLLSNGTLIGLNYWGGWAISDGNSSTDTALLDTIVGGYLLQEDNSSHILLEDGSGALTIEGNAGNYFLNPSGILLQQYYSCNLTTTSTSTSSTTTSTSTTTTSTSITTSTSTSSSSSTSTTTTSTSTTSTSSSTTTSTTTTLTSTSTSTSTTTTMTSTSTSTTTSTSSSTSTSTTTTSTSTTITIEMMFYVTAG